MNETETRDEDSWQWRFWVSDYEAILGVRFDRRNFAAKMLKLGLLLPTGDRPADAARRIPQLYRFDAGKYQELKQSGFRLEF